MSSMHSQTYLHIHSICPQRLLRVPQAKKVDRVAPLIVAHVTNLSSLLMADTEGQSVVLSTLIADPPRCNSTNRQNLPMQQNLHNF